MTPEVEDPKFTSTVTEVSNVSNFGPTVTERLAAPQSQFKVLKEDIFKTLRVCAPAVVYSFNESEGTVSVQLAVTEKIQLNVNGPNVSSQNPLNVQSQQITPGQAATGPGGVTNYILKDVPILIPTGGGWSFTLPIQPGDECLVAYSDTELDMWFLNGGPSNVPISSRRHNLSDPIAIFGLRSTPNLLEKYSTNSAQLRNDDSTVVLDLSDDGVKITAPATTINSTTTITGDTITLNGSGVTLTVGDGRVSITVPLGTLYGGTGNSFASFGDLASAIFGSLSSSKILAGIGIVPTTYGGTGTNFSSFSALVNGIFSNFNGILSTTVGGTGGSYSNQKELIGALLPLQVAGGVLTGYYPNPTLNLTDPVVSKLINKAGVLIDTYANWTSAKYDPSTYPSGTEFVISDWSGVVYIVSGGVWVYESGVYQNSLGSLPTQGYNGASLGSHDANLRFFENATYFHQLQWNGSAWQRGPEDREHSDTFHDFGSAPSDGGWHSCDGSTVTYLNYNGTTSSRTLPNLVSTPAYPKTGNSYAGVTPASTPTFAGAPIYFTDLPINPAGSAPTVLAGPSTVTPSGTITLPDDPIPHYSVIRYYRR